MSGQVTWVKRVSQWFSGSRALRDRGVSQKSTVSEGATWEALLERLRYSESGFAGQDIAEVMTRLLDRIEALESLPPPPQTEG